MIAYQKILLIIDLWIILDQINESYEHESDDLGFKFEVPASPADP